MKTVVTACLFPTSRSTTTISTISLKMLRMTRSDQSKRLEINVCFLKHNVLLKSSVYKATQQHPYLWRQLMNPAEILVLCAHEDSTVLKLRKYKMRPCFFGGGFLCFVGL